MRLLPPPLQWSGAAYVCGGGRGGVQRGGCWQRTVSRGAKISLRKKIQGPTEHF